MFKLKNKGFTRAYKTQHLNIELKIQYKMQISELKPRQNKVDIEVEIKDNGDIKEFEKFWKKGRLATATVTDSSGEIQLTLWNDDIDLIKVGDKIKINNGYVNEFQGEKQLTAGRFGKIEVVKD